MAIDPALEADILRYHFVERWRVNTIALQLGVHHSTVERVLAHAGIPKAQRTRQHSILDPYTPLIIETLQQYPKLSAARLYAMAQARGFTGASSHFRAHVAQLRPKPQPEAYLRLKTLPAEQAQVDWGHFDYVSIGNAKRPLMAFVIVLSWSRHIFLRFYLNQKLDNFIRGHVEAFDTWQGVPRVCLYDNLKSVVLERRGDAIRFHPTFLSLSAHYHFEPRPVAVARGNEKGRVERAIRYIRSSFFAGRQWSDVDDLNRQADQWCARISGERRCPQDTTLSVNQAFEQERTALIALPENPFPSHERIGVKVGKTPYVRFDLNDYSVPPTHVRCTLSINATLERVRVLDGSELIAEHERHYGKGEQIEDPRHIEQLLDLKREGRQHRSYDRLTHAVPECTSLLTLAGEQGHPLATTVGALTKLLDEYGATELKHAVQEALLTERAYPSAVHQVLERRREARQQPPPLRIALPPSVSDIAVQPATLSDYDTLNHANEDECGNDNRVTGASLAPRQTTTTDSEDCDDDTTQ